MDVSLDFAQRDKHNEFRGQNLAYDWAINTLKMLKEDGKKSTIVFVAFNETLREKNISELFDIANKYNSILRMNIYRPVSNDATINSKFICKYDEIMNFLNYVNENHNIISIKDMLFGNILCNENINIKDNTGVNSIRILPNGKISPSTYLISEEFTHKYHINQDNVLSILNFSDSIKNILPAKCEGCEFENSCAGGVIDRRILWYGTLKQRDPYCPKRLRKKIPCIKFKQSSERVSVHDEYLPTMFFKY